MRCVSDDIKNRIACASRNKPTNSQFNFNETATNSMNRLITRKASRWISI